MMHYESQVNRSSGDNRDMPRASEPTPDIAHYDNGAVRFRGFRIDGEMHAVWEFFRKDGSVMRSGTFHQGKQVGIWRTFDRAGKVVKETRFSKGA